MVAAAYFFPVRVFEAVSVTPGNYVVQAEMPDATGPLQFSMGLVGDANGDH